MSAELERLSERLEAIAEELADLAIEALRESIDADLPERAADERRITKARRAVERAVALLSEPARES